MNFELLMEEFRIAEHLLAILLGMPRIFLIIQTVPFMGASIVTGQLRITLALACYMILHPAIVASLPSQEFAGISGDYAFYGAIILKETLIGVMIGLLAGMLFWAVQSAGFFIDNQRGATQAAGPDPLSGEQTSPLGSFLFQSVIYIFFAGGAFMVFLRLIYTSYSAWPVMSLAPLEMVLNQDFPIFFAKQVSYLLLLTMLLSGPIVMACLLTDVSLGLMNRFASQLNVYVLAMPVKSGLASFLIIFYLGMLLQEVVPLFHSIIDNFEEMRDLV